MKPPGWTATVTRVKRRAGGRCEAVLDNGRRCHNPGAVCDHLIAQADGGPDTDDNLRWICTTHDRAKSSAEGHAHRRPKG